MFQSRHRDAFHFRETARRLSRRRGPTCFNLVIEMLVISGKLSRRSGLPRSSFQSRHRDAFHFRGLLLDKFDACFIMFQSRNRDAFHFRWRSAMAAFFTSSRFNLVIEMLFISGFAEDFLIQLLHMTFQSRHRDAFHFRCNPAFLCAAHDKFQSRNRDAFHFR